MIDLTELDPQVYRNAAIRLFESDISNRVGCCGLIQLEFEFQLCITNQSYEKHLSLFLAFFEAQRHLYKWLSPSYDLEEGPRSLALLLIAEIVKEAIDNEL